MRIQLLTFALLLSSAPAYAVPVVPNFTQGSMTSRTEQITRVTESIVSLDYATGWQYSVTGSNIQHSGSSMSPDTENQTTQVTNGVRSTWTGLNVSQKPDWTLAVPGAAFQFTETYSGPGLSQQTIIERTTEINSVTETTSVFQQ